MSDIRRQGASKKTGEFQPLQFSEALEHPESPESIEYIFTPLGANLDQVTMTLAEAKEKATETLKSAQDQAEALLTAAREESSTLKKEAAKIRSEAADNGFTEGFAKGMAEGRDQGKKDFETEVEPSIAALAMVENLYQELWTVNEATMVKLAMKIAERVLFQEVATSPEIVSATFKAALDHLHEQHRVTFRVHPEDLSQLEILRIELRDTIKGLVKITFDPDPNLARGDLIMETDAGRLDATLRRRIASVTGTVDEVLKNNFDLDW